jgi:hypothetical protein
MEEKKRFTPENAEGARRSVYSRIKPAERALLIRYETNAAHDPSM